MSDHKDKKYDVAISLRWTDVEQARELYELLRDRLDVFFADERPEDFVGTDGEESFGYIFRDRVRVVVVLYRPDWGTTPFTRAEEGAIKQRAWHDGYGFSLWVPMDEAKSVPPYLPPQYIWHDFDRYGAAGLASVVEQRVRESGREVRPETAADRLLRIKRRIDLGQQRRLFKRSQDGIDFVSDASQHLENVLTSQIKEYEAIISEIDFEVVQAPDGFVVMSLGYRCVFELYKRYSNTITGASLTARLQQFDRKADHDWRVVERFEFKPTLDNDGDPSWKLKDGHYYSLEAAIAHVLDEMAEKVYLAVEKDKDIENW